jgi:hypothetical protein
LALSEASFAAVSGRSYDCLIGNTLLILNEADAATLRRVLAERKSDGKYRYSHQSVATTLTMNGHRVGPTTVQKHRMGNCRCL